jgi:hypothetical protein
MGTRMVPAYQNKAYHARDVQSDVSFCDEPNTRNFNQSAEDE